MLSAHPNRPLEQLRRARVLPQRQEKPRDVEQHVVVRLERIHERRQLAFRALSAAYLLQLQLQIARIDAEIGSQPSRLHQKRPQLPETVRVALRQPDHEQKQPERQHRLAGERRLQHADRLGRPAVAPLMKRPANAPKRRARHAEAQQRHHAVPVVLRVLDETPTLPREKREEVEIHGNPHIRAERHKRLFNREYFVSLHHASIFRQNQRFPRGPGEHSGKQGNRGYRDDERGARVFGVVFREQFRGNPVVPEVERRIEFPRETPLESGRERNNGELLEIGENERIGGEIFVLRGKEGDNRGSEARRTNGKNVLFQAAEEAVEDEEGRDVESVR